MVTCIEKVTTDWNSRLRGTAILLMRQDSKTYKKTEKTQISKYIHAVINGVVAPEYLELTHIKGEDLSSEVCDHVHVRLKQGCSVTEATCS